MRIMRAIVVLVAVVMVAGRYFQERSRLAVVRRLPAARARDYYEVARRRGDRGLVVVVGMFAVAAVVAVIRYAAMGQGK